MSYLKVSRKEGFLGFVDGVFFGEVGRYSSSSSSSSSSKSRSLLEYVTSKLMTVGLALRGLCVPVCLLFDPVDFDVGLGKISYRDLVFGWVRNAQR